MNTKEIREQTVVVDDLRAKRDSVVASRNAILAVNCRQNTAAISFAGTRFDISTLNRCYMPETIEGMEIIQAECAKLLQAQIGTLESKLLGAENKLRKLVSFSGEQ